MEAISTPSIEGFPVRKIPEARRPRQITARPKASTPCIWRRIARAEREMIGMVMAFSGTPNNQGSI